MKKKTKKTKMITAEEFDKKFDEGKEDILQYTGPKPWRVVPPMVQRINIDIPVIILQKVDKEADRVGVARTSLIKMWIAEHADRLAS